MIIAYNQNSGRTLIFNNLEEAMPHMKAVCDRAPNTKWYVGEITGTYGMPVQIQPEFRPGYDGPQRDRQGNAIRQPQPQPAPVPMYGVARDDF